MKSENDKRPLCFRKWKHFTANNNCIKLKYNEKEWWIANEGSRSICGIGLSNSLKNNHHFSWVSWLGFSNTNIRGFYQRNCCNALPFLLHIELIIEYVFHSVVKAALFSSLKCMKYLSNSLSSGRHTHVKPIFIIKIFLETLLSHIAV